MEVRDWRTGSNDRETDPELVSTTQGFFARAKECSEPGQPHKTICYTRIEWFMNGKTEGVLWLQEGLNFDHASDKERVS